MKDFPIDILGTDMCGAQQKAEIKIHGFQNISIVGF